VLAVLAVTRKHLADARDGRGPSLIEAFTYRMGAHTTSDDPTRYRLASDLEAWRLKDPIERVRSFLWRQQLADQEFFDGVDAEAEALAVRLREGCRSLPDPDPDRMFDQVYAEPHPLVEEERAEFTAYLASFEGAEGVQR
jgi:pyruvate dehydrogenase E1 component alpha subunit